MAGDAVESFDANQITAVFVAAHFVFAPVPRSGFHIGAGIGCGKELGQLLGVRFAEIGHACGEVRPHGAVAAQNLMQRGFGELGPDARKCGRSAAFIAEIFA